MIFGAMRPFLIAAIASAIFLFSMAVPDDVRAGTERLNGLDTSAHSRLLAKFEAERKRPVDLVLIWSDVRLDTSQSKWLRAHEVDLRAELTHRFTLAGIDSLILSAPDLEPALMRQLEYSPLRTDKRLTGNLGVVRVDFSEDDVMFDKYGKETVPLMSALEYTYHGRVTVFMGNLGSHFGSHSCNQVCAVANVVSHGTGHAIGFDDPGHSVPFFPFSLPEFVRTILLREPPDVMMQGQAFDHSALQFNMRNFRNQLVLRRLRLHLSGSQGLQPDAPANAPNQNATSAQNNRKFRSRR